MTLPSEPTPTPEPMTDQDRYEDPEQRYSYRSALIERLRGNDHQLTVGRITVRTARSFGFCWGVDRAVAMVDDAIARHPGRRLWLLDQMIHNPRVNADFKRQGVRFLRGPFADAGQDTTLREDDVVVVPAFSATVEDMDRLRAAGCTIVDTTCPWVIRPHRRTEKYVEDGFTTLIHGLTHHEETRASCSLIASKGGHYVVVADHEQAADLCAHLRGELGFDALRARLPRAAFSEGFDPVRHVARIGMINQTTMLAAETRQIEDMVRAAIVARDGCDDAFRALDTICRATQENQDAVGELAERGSIDLLLVVGGYDSSNTRNLTRTSRRFPAFHVLGPDAITPSAITHRDTDNGRIRTTRDWLPDGDVVVGFTAGASTPDTLLGETIERVIEAAGEVPAVGAR